MNSLRVSSLIVSASLAACLGCNPAPTPKPSPTPTPKSSAVSPSTEPQAATSITPSPNEPANHTYTTDQVLTCTVSECWQLAGRDEDKFFDIVQQLAVLSADHRHLTLPESDVAGKQAGEYIKAQAKQDRGQLLYAVVDAAVRKVGTPGIAKQ
ncbi:MAG TPA: hypothetical protein VGG95_02980 [Edaphobacter sp.]|jgi:hypothetical protein